jgi:G:T-mismatch repair DNA endonuclease (very short patch repair protein)
MMGWNVIIVWECELGSKAKLHRTIEKTVRRLEHMITGGHEVTIASHVINVVCTAADKGRAEQSQR